MKQRGFILPGLDMFFIGAAVLGIVLAIVFFQMYRSVSDEYAKFKADVVAQEAILEANAEKARMDSERLAADTTRGWSAAVAYWRNRSGRVVRVRDTSCGAQGLRPIPESTGLTPPAGSELELGATVDVAIEQCEALLNKAVMDAAQLTHLQAWVKQQSEVAR